ncbi:hypothetical protein [Phaeobacter sp. HF9A]|uniref:hypothetical protein n=1 Tax=Phaeobacter sp. HF9A TaxID=2721561 RepID=UPI0020CA8487|nr:hypothetical protein [Phaeobacter sp. HF9A]
MQVELYQPDRGELAWKLLPALRYALSEQREVIAGVELRSFGAHRVGLRLELWQRF